MKKRFICSLCHRGILGGALYLDNEALTYKTNKLTVDKAYKRIVLPLNEIVDISWHRRLFPVATLHMQDGKEHKLMIFNKRRFMKWYKQIKNSEI